MEYAWGFLTIMSIAGFSVCAHDKRAAKRGRQRVSERELLAISASGGSLGVLAAMLITRHKTKKLKFVLGVPLIIALQAAAVIAAILYQ